MIEFQRPQLCKVMTKKKDWRADAALIPWMHGPWMAEFKLDGHRRLLGHDQAWSRIGRDRPSPMIQRAIAPGTLLDGELVVTGDTNSGLVSHVQAEDPDKLIFVAFDILYDGGESVMEMPWSHRRILLRQKIEQMLRFDARLVDLVRESTALPVLGLGDIERLMLTAEEMRLEGLVLKKNGAPYKPHSRSAWIKLKFTDLYDVVITDCDSKPTEWRVRPGEIGHDGVLYPEGRHSEPWLAGHVGLSYGFVIDGKLMHVGSLGKTGPREEMSQHVGKVAEVKAYGQFEDTGALRHPVFIRFRDDKLPEECTFVRTGGADGK